jgi:hypothetical protein
LPSGESVLEDSLLGGDLDDPPPRSLCEGTDQDDLHVAVTAARTRVSRSRFGGMGHVLIVAGVVRRLRIVG